MKVYGRDQVQRWRRSYHEAPPGLPRNPDDPDDPRNQPPFRDSPLYNIQTENLADVVNRVQSVYEAEIVPLRNAGKTVVLIAHGNTNRALIKLALDLSEQEIESVELPTGVPVIVTNREWALVSDLGLRRHQSLQKTPEYLAWAQEVAGSQRG